MKFIIPILTAADLAALPAAVSYMKSQSASGFWLIFSPAIGLGQPEGLAALDKQLADLMDAKAAAAKRDDFAAALSFKEQIDARTMEKDNLIRGNFKTLALDVRQKIYDRILAPATSSGLPGILDSLPDHIEASDFFRFMETMANDRWPDQFTHGEYVLLWPKAVANQQQVIDSLRVPVPVAPASSGQIKEQGIRVDALGKVLVDPSGNPTREAELRASRFAGVKATAKKLGVFEDGLKFDDLIERVLAKENEVEKEVAAY